MGEIARIYKSKMTGELKHKCCPGFGMSSNLVYDLDTKVIYYKDSKNNDAFMCPYISKNGKFCRFINDQIVEIG